MKKTDTTREDAAPVCVTYVWTREEHLNSLRRHREALLRPAFLWAYNSLILLAAAGGVGAIVAIPDARFHRNGYLLLAVTLYWFLFRPWRRDYRAKRQFAMAPEANLPIHWSFSPHGVVQNCEGLNTSTLDWKFFSKVIEAKDGFLLYQQPPTVLHWLPFHAFQSTDDIANFRSLVRSAGIASF